MFVSLLQFFHQLILIAALHPLHVSVTEILYDEKEKELEVTVRVFADDLEVTLRKTFNRPELDILNEKEPVVDEMMRSYFKDHFAVALDKNSQTTAYLGHEKDGDAFIFYIGVSKVKKWKTITVKNDLLIDIFEDQSNLVHVTVHDEVKSLRLTQKSHTSSLTF